MAVLKLSQIAALGASPASTDQIVSVVTGNTDNLVSYAQATGALSPFTTGAQGVAPASGGGTVNFLRADATWQPTAQLNVADQTIAGGANVTSLSLATGNVTIDCGARPLQFISNNGNFTITAPANDGSCMLLVTNTGAAGTITFSGFSTGSNTGDALDTTNGHKFTISIWRINGTSGWRAAAHQ
jgi:hypothetical protein